MPKLCDTFQSRSRATWALLRKARLLGHQIGEETITDLNLLEIRRRHPAEIRVIPFNKPEEGITGADWEWWFAGSTGWWAPFRIQAKILSPASQEFEELHRRNRNTGEYQSDRLIREAAGNSQPIAPLFCLYSNWDTRAIRPWWRCRSFPQRSPAFGCALVPAPIIPRLRTARRKGLQDLLPFMLPWHCLVCCHGFDQGDLAQRATALWRGMMMPMVDFVAGRFPAGATDTEGGVSAEAITRFSDYAPWERPPDYVMRALDGVLPEVVPEGVCGIVVVREAG